MRIHTNKNEKQQQYIMLAFLSHNSRILATIAELQAHMIAGINLGGKP